MEADKLNELCERCARIETKQDTAISRLDKLNGKVADHEARLQDHKSKLDGVTGKVKLGVAVIVGGLLGSRPELIDKILTVLAK